MKEKFSFFCFFDSSLLVSMQSATLIPSDFQELMDVERPSSYGRQTF